LGRLSPTSPESAVSVVEADLTAAGQATPWLALAGSFNLTIAGTFVGTAVVERSFDGGTTAVPCTNLGEVVSFSAPATERLTNDERGVLFRARCTAYTSGTIRARLSQ
jgi:hypothetical protein